jgi:predicted metal-dependent hydrolase
VTDAQHNPLILGFVADLFFAVKIEKAANQLDFEIRWIENADQIAPEDPGDLNEHQAEPLVGREGVLLDNITKWKPSLIIFDLNNPSIPWNKWINLLTSVPASRRIPIICFGSHIDVEVMKAARLAGAKKVLARSIFVSQLPEVIKKYARLIDQDALLESCQKSLPEIAVRGLEAFNRGDYFEAHEHLEKVWMDDQGPGRELYQAVLQVAVAYYQILRGNYKGAAKLFLRMRQWIDPLPDVCRGVDIGKLRAEAQLVHQKLLELGPNRIKELDLSMLRPVSYRLKEQDGSNDE